DDQSHAITTAAPLSCPHHSTSHRVRMSARGAGPTPRRGRSHPPYALGAGASTPPGSPVGAQIPFFEFFHACGRTDMQHARRSANATGVHGPIDDLLLDLRRLTGVAIRQEKGPSTPLEARPAPIALLAFRRQTMLDNIGLLAI